MTAAPAPVSRVAAGVRLVHPLPSLLVAAVTLVLGLTIPADPDPATVGALAAAMLAFQFAIGASNDVLDYPADLSTERDKPLVRGAVSLPAARGIAAAAIAAGLLITITLPLDAWLIGLAGLACGLVYNARLKHTALSWVPLAVALPLIPAWVARAHGDWDPLLAWAFIVGPMLGFAIHLANQVAGIDSGDPAAGLAGRISATRALGIAVTIFGLGVSLATVLVLFRDEGLGLMLACTGAIVALLTPRSIRRLGGQGPFVALTAGGCAVALFYTAAI